jgi:hypothetical protein
VVHRQEADAYSLAGEREKITEAQVMAMFGSKPSCIARAAARTATSRRP